MEQNNKLLINFIRKEPVCNQFGPIFLDGFPLYLAYFKSIATGEEITVTLCDSDKYHAIDREIKSTRQLFGEYDVICDNSPYGLRSVKVPLKQLQSHYFSVKDEYDRVTEHGGNIEHPNSKMKAIYNPKYKEYDEESPLLYYAGRDKEYSGMRCWNGMYGIYYHKFIDIETGQVMTAIISEAAGQLRDFGFPFNNNWHVLGIYGSVEEAIGHYNVLHRRRNGRVLPLKETANEICDKYERNISEQPGEKLSEKEATAKKIIYDLYDPLKQQKPSVNTLIGKLLVKR